MPGRSGDWWLVTSHSKLLIPAFKLLAAASPQKRKPTPPRCARQPLPREGGSRGHSLLPMEGGAPKGRRLDGESGMKKSGGDRLKSTIYESTLSTADAVPLPRWGRQRGGGFAAKRKPTPPRCARQPLPKEGARVDTPSFLWKEVPRRGGGWMKESGIFVSKPSPHGKGGERSEPDRAPAV